MTKTSADASLRKDPDTKMAPALGPEDSDVGDFGKKITRVWSVESLLETKDDFLSLEDGTKLDDYISHHTGQTMLKKMGGEPMQRTRRLVLAALARHMGCLSLCASEVFALSNNDKSSSDRPCEPLLDLWRGAKGYLSKLSRRSKRPVCTTPSFVSP